MLQLALSTLHDAPLGHFSWTERRQFEDFLLFPTSQLFLNVPSMPQWDFARQPCKLRMEAFHAVAIV